MTTNKYTREVLEDAVLNSTSVAGVLRYLGLLEAGGTHSHISGKIKKFGIDTGHFTGRGWSKGRTFPHKKSTADILVMMPKGVGRPRRKELLRAMLDSGLTYQCVGCYNDGTWEDHPLTLEIDHIDGNWLNNLIENLRFLCPNCHSQCSTNTAWKNQAGVGELGISNRFRPCDRTDRARSSRVARTCECGKSISQRATQCKSCATSGRFVIDWPTDVELIAMLAESNYTQVGLKLGVSDNAVRKHLNEVH